MQKTGYLKRLLNPVLFQGDLSYENYFEGWYFKNVSGDASEVLSFIPGISLTRDKKMAFVQYIDGKLGKTSFFEYPLNEFKTESGRFELQVGPNRFRENGMEIDLDGNGTRIKGHFDFGRFARYPRSVFAPGIMGWYSYVPVMECYHGIVSMNHSINGEIKINRRNYDFNNGKGYIEKDWGVSFPERWIWVQANSFQARDASFMLSIAKIPWRGHFFSGFLCFLYVNGNIYRFMTYNRSRIEDVRSDGNLFKAALSNRRYKISIEVRSAGYGKLLAPRTGRMDRVIKESIDALLMVELRDHSDRLIFQGESPRAGFENVGNMAALLKGSA